MKVPQTMSRKSVQCIVAVAVIGVAWLAPTAVEAQTGPDLVVESPSVTDSTPTSGTTFTLSATVRNAGDGASAATMLRFYRSTDATITTSDAVQGINAETVTGLAASESSSSHSLDILAPPAPVQFYYGACVTAVADESDTTNNCSGSVLVRVQAQTTVTIAADHASFTAVLDQVTFTLTRTGDPAEGLDVSVALTQDKDLIGSDHLAQTVTFRAGEATATLSIYPYFFRGNTVTGETVLTATVQDGSGYVPGSSNTASTRIRVADPAVTASFEQSAYTFDEAAGDATVAVILRTATGVLVPHADIFLSINTAIITDGASPDDFEKPAGSIQFVPSDFTADGTNFTARKEVTLAIVDDALDEPDEALTVILEPLPSTQAVVALSEPNGTPCPTARRCDATVTITDNDSAVATLSGLAVSGGGAELLTFASDNTTYTAMVANDVETLTFSATKSDAGASVAYLDSDGNTLDDADTTEGGFQVALAVGANAITVRVTAENGTTQDYTVTVTRAEGLPTVTVAAAIFSGRDGGGGGGRGVHAVAHRVDDGSADGDGDGEPDRGGVEGCERGAVVGDLRGGCGHGPAGAGDRRRRHGRRRRDGDGDAGHRHRLHGGRPGRGDGGGERQRRAGGLRAGGAGDGGRGRGPGDGHGDGDDGRERAAGDGTGGATGARQRHGDGRQ